MEVILKARYYSDCAQEIWFQNKKFFFHISLLPQSLQTSVRRQLKIHDNTPAELEDGLCKTRVLKILFKEENSSSVREEAYNVI